MAARNDVDTVTIYPGLFFCREDVPEVVARLDSIGPGMWFDLQGDDVPDVQGIIESKQSDNPFLFAPDHPLVSAVIGKDKGDEVELRPEMGPARRYIVRDIKHKYVWLLHDIMATHATHFPKSTSMFEMSIKDGDVQPVLDYVRELSDRSKAITQSYTDLAIPLSAVAAMSRKSVIEFSEHLVQSGISLHTCLGSAQERTEAIGFAADACRQGAILDTLTAWNAFRLGLLPELKAHFGRLLVPRSSIDEIVELRGKEEVNRGRETMTLGYDGDQAVRDVRSPEDVERVIGIYDRVLVDLQSHCEIMPSDGSDDLRFDDDRVAWIAVAKILDPIYLARSTGMLLLSEDLRLRQLAGHAGAANGAWLQAALRAMVGSAESALSQPQYLTAVGQLAALRHDHIWLDVPTLYGLLTLDDTRAETLFDCAASYIGCENAEMGSHVGVVLDFMCIAWNAQIPAWKQGRAIGKLLNNLIRHRRSDWRDVLLVMNRELKVRSSTSHGAIHGQEYLQQWCHGHFLEIDFADATGLGQGTRRQPRRSKR